MKKRPSRKKGEGRLTDKKSGGVFCAYIYFKPWLSMK